MDMISKKLADDVTAFLNMHIETQMKCMQLSQQLNLKGFPGFAHFYQLQSNDEFMHQRRIQNFLQNTYGSENYVLKAPDFKPFEIAGAKEAIEFYINMRQETLQTAMKFKADALAEQNYLVAEFYTWFIKDYWTEIDENSDTLDRINMNGSVIAGLDRRAGERGEINAQNVIHPMKGFVVEDGEE